MITARPQESNTVRKLEVRKSLPWINVVNRQLREITKESLQEGNEVDQTNRYPPVDVVHDVLALPPDELKFPPLHGIIEAPSLRPDGTLIDQPGYDRSTGLFYFPGKGLKLPSIPNQPTKADIKRSLQIINEPIHEFPFVDAGGANPLAMILTPICRSAIEGPVLMACVDAPSPGPGKTLLSEIPCIIATGREATLLSPPKDGEEWRRQLTSILRPSPSVVVFDNICTRLDSPELSKVLTASSHGDRILGSNQLIELPVRCTWIANGNNLEIGGDIPRRCYWIRLDAKCSKPFQRTGFKHPNLKKWIQDHRIALLVALLTLVRAWYAAGCPKPSVRPVGSFEDWTIVIGGILEYAGVPRFLANSDELYHRAISWRVIVP